MYNKYKEAFLTLNITLTQQDYNKLYSYAHLLKKWNKVMNLTSIDDDDGILWRHFIDSCKILEYIKISPSDKMIDVGTGAGFPGLPIAIMSGVQTTLLDALNKRVNFLNEVLKENDLKNVSVIHGRAEEIARVAEHREAYDFVFSRAVTKMSSLLEYTIPFLKVGGMLIAYKSENINEEILNAQNALKKLNCHVVEKIEYLDISNISRNFVLIKKDEYTSDIYPRRPGLPTKRPL